MMRRGVWDECSPCGLEDRISGTHGWWIGVREWKPRRLNSMIRGILKGAFIGDDFIWKVLVVGLCSSINELYLWFSLSFLCV